MNIYELQSSRAGTLMGDPVELGSNTGIIASLASGVTLAVGWGISIALKRLGLTATSASEANSQSQKDMLDWQREQLKDEVIRREKAEAQVQNLLERQNEFTLQMAKLEMLNQQLQDQVHVLTLTVEQLKTRLTGAESNAS